MCVLARWESGVYSVQRLHCGLEVLNSKPDRCKELISSPKHQDRIQDLPSLMFSSHWSALPVLRLNMSGDIRLSPFSPFACSW